MTATPPAPYPDVETDRTERMPAMPRTLPRPTHFTAADVAAVKGVTPHAVSRMLYAARVEFDRKGVWPDWTPPAPEPRVNNRGPLLWRADRKDVRAWLADPERKVWK